MIHKSFTFYSAQAGWKLKLLERDMESSDFWDFELSTTDSRLLLQCPAVWAFPVWAFLQLFVSFKAYFFSPGVIIYVSIYQFNSYRYPRQICILLNFSLFGDKVDVWMEIFHRASAKFATKNVFPLLTVKHRSCGRNRGEAGKREAKFKKQIYKKMLQRILNFILVLVFDKFCYALHTINQFVSCLGKLYA